MDLCFTKRELSWLDDLMPESKKKKEDDKKKKAKEVSGIVLIIEAKAPIEEVFDGEMENIFHI